MKIILAIASILLFSSCITEGKGACAQTDGMSGYGGNIHRTKMIGR